MFNLHLYLNLHLLLEEGQITPKGEVSEPEPMEESKQTLHEENEESAQISERGADDAPILGPIAHDEDEPIGIYIYIHIYIYIYNIHRYGKRGAVT